MIRYKLKVRKSKSTPQTEIPPYHYKGLVKLTRKFTMTKNILALRGENDKILHIRVKVIFACMLASALKDSKFPRLLTTSRRLSEHFKVTPQFINQLIAQFKRLNLITCRDFTPDENFSGLMPRERPIEIIFTGYDKIMYKSGREGDFFFIADLDTYADKMDEMSRMFLFMIQCMIDHNQQKYNMPAVTWIALETVAKIFGCSIQWVRSFVKYLEQNRFIRKDREGSKIFMRIMRR